MSKNYTGPFAFRSGTFAAAVAVIQDQYAGNGQQITGYAKVWGSQAEADNAASQVGVNLGPNGGARNVLQPLTNVKIVATLAPSQAPADALNAAFLAMSEFTGWTAVAGS